MVYIQEVMVTSWQNDSLKVRAAVELQGCRFNSCWQACNCSKTVCTSTSVGSTNVKLLSVLSGGYITT